MTILAIYMLVLVEMVIMSRRTSNHSSSNIFFTI